MSSSSSAADPVAETPTLEQKIGVLEQKRDFIVDLLNLPDSERQTATSPNLKFNYLKRYNDEKLDKEKDQITQEILALRQEKSLLLQREQQNPLWLQHQPPPVAPVPVIAQTSTLPELQFLTIEEEWVDVDVSLASLSGIKGFRRFVQSNALRIGISGYIRRYIHRRITVVYEGDVEAVQAFRGLKVQWGSWGMLQSVIVKHETATRMRTYPTFAILKDFSRHTSRNGVQAGCHSGNEFDKISEFSADSMQSR